MLLYVLVWSTYDLSVCLFTCFFYFYFCSISVSRRLQTESHIKKDMNISLFDKLLTNYSQVTHKLLTSYSQVTHKSLTSHSQVTHKLLTSYSQVTHKLFTSYSQVTHKLLTYLAQIAFDNKNFWLMQPITGKLNAGKSNQFPIRNFIRT